MDGPTKKLETYLKAVQLSPERIDGAVALDFVVHAFEKGATVESVVKTIGDYLPVPSRDLPDSDDIAKTLIGVNTYMMKQGRFP